MNARKDAFFRRQTAIHEAGHVTAAEHLGAKNVSSRVWHSPRRRWDGVARVPDITKMNDRERHVIGAAGGIAVLISYGIRIPTTRPFSFFLLKETSALFSKTDWPLIGYTREGRSLKMKLGTDFTAIDRDIAFTETLLKREWNKVLSTARQIIVASRSESDFRRAA